MAQTFEGPPTLERSGSEHRRAVSSLAPEERGAGVRGGAFLKGKEGRVGFRKNPSLTVRKVSVPCEGNRKGLKDL